MALDNIYERRAYIKAKLEKGEQIRRKQAIEIAKLFGCASGSIQADVRRYLAAKDNVLIYALCDPDLGEIRYIGQTDRDPEDRMGDHIRSCARGSDKNVAKTTWIMSLLNNNKKPSLIILESCPCKTAREREQWWIKHHLAQGVELVNVIGTHLTLRDMHNGDCYEFIR